MLPLCSLLRTVQSCRCLLAPTVHCRSASFWRKDRTTDLDAMEKIASAGEVTKTPEVKRPSAVLGDRHLSGSVTCSDRRVAPRQAWVESLRSADPDNAYLDLPTDIIDLHPDIFATFPRIDLVHKNLSWQAHYRLVDWRCITTRAELLHRSRRKPWPQKGTGRARHGNRRTHIWKGGGQCKGPRGPESFFSVLPYSVRVTGLLSMLTIKHAQGDLHIVEDLSLSEELEEASRSVYELANNRALRRLRLEAAESSPEATNTAATSRDLLARLALSEAELLASSRPLEQSDLHAAMERENEETEELLDLIKGGKAAEAAKVAYEAAEYLRRLVDSREWGPAVLFITEGEAFLGKQPDDASPPSTANLAIALACASYAQYIDSEVAPEAAVHSPPVGSMAAAPRALHPGRGLTLMPLHGLNVWSMVHHDTLVLTRRSLDLLEARLLDAQRKVNGQLHQQQALRGDYDGPPLADDWLIDEQGYGLGLDDVDPEPRRNRHFSERLKDLDLLRKRLS
ncbi:hypothetical protein AAHC03_025787 [Spirometra sp. Aus1]